MNRAGIAASLCWRSLVVALGLSLTACSAAPAEPDGERFGLLSSLPIYRAPQASVADALTQGEGTPHWLRAEIEARNTLDPLDHLDTQSLAQIDTLLLIQPRALTPPEFVALDDWVRAGGRVLLVADPMLASEPQFPLGDPRNPEAVAVTGPIEARWGLELKSGKFGDGAEERVSVEGHEVAIAFGGVFVKRPPAGGETADCGLRDKGLLAVCSIGEGHAVLLADATVFEGQGDAKPGAALFWSLLGILGDEDSR